MNTVIDRNSVIKFDKVCILKQLYYIYNFCFSCLSHKNIH